MISAAAPGSIAPVGEFICVFYSLEIVQTIKTPDGPVSIAPHAMARAAVEALIDTGRTPASVRDEYVRASADAMMKVSPGPFPSAEALTAWVNAAANRWRIQPEPISIAELFPVIEKHGGHDD